MYVEIEAEAAQFPKKEYRNFRCSVGRMRLGEILTVPYLEHALQRHCTKNVKKIFPDVKLRGLVPNSVSDLYISTIGPPILLQQKRWTDRGNI
jgi:hypothetical protein